MPNYEHSFLASRLDEGHVMIQPIGKRETRYILQKLV